MAMGMIPTLPLVALGGIPRMAMDGCRIRSERRGPAPWAPHTGRAGQGASGSSAIASVRSTAQRRTRVAKEA